jgi:Probable molybdopterin binding domain
LAGNPDASPVIRSFPIGSALTPAELGEIERKIFLDRSSPARSRRISRKAICPCCAPIAGNRHGTVGIDPVSRRPTGPSELTARQALGLQYGHKLDQTANPAVCAHSQVIMPTANSSASKETVTAALLVIGGKILSGRTKDQNIGYIAEYLTAAGIDLKEVRVVGDEERAIVDALNALRHRYTYVFTTGGNRADSR